jgi:HAD superfamily hydrolase (TIGR01509 family)
MDLMDDTGEARRRRLSPHRRGRYRLNDPFAWVNFPTATISSMTLEAVVFDVDGTLVDSERDGHRVAFNRAFEEFGLVDQWDEELYGRLLQTTGGQRRLDAYFASQGRPQTERDELVPRIHRRKTEIIAEMIEQGQLQPRPGVSRLLAELEDTGTALAIATTGSRRWVERLLDRLFGLERFSVVVTGNEVTHRKPHPEVYTRAVTELARSSHHVVAVEDSANGLASARAAGLTCLVVINGYTADQRLQDADLVVDSFGADGERATVLHDPHRLGITGPIRAATLSQLLEASVLQSKRTTARDIRRSTTR